jgi:predicted phosphodiesterase
MLIIGDVHGKIQQYEQIIKKEKAKESVQLGDFGFRREHDWFLANMEVENHRVLFGNHDYYPYLQKPHSVCCSIARFIEGDIFFIRGAYSPDYKMRTMGLDLFEDEEIPYREFEDILDYYKKCRPSAVVSHDCPQFIPHSFFAYPTKINTRTGHLLEALYQEHQPDLWVFGHHHRSWRMKIGNTEFRCLDELECYYV